MQFNGKKFELLRYGRITSDNSLPEYLTPDGLPISRVESVRDLGVIVEYTASFDTQIDSMCSKARQQAGWVLRTFRCREIKPMLVLYRAMVMPYLEYCSQLWSPVTIGHIRRLETVQRNYTSKIWEVNNLNYWERLGALQLYSLERRRERYIILYVFKIIAGVVPNFQNDRFCIKTQTNNRRGKFCSIPPLNNQASARMKTKVDSSFAVRGPRLFNCLPQKLRNHEGSVDSFKCILDKLLASVPDKPLLPNYPRQQAESNSLLHQIAFRLTNDNIV